MYTTSCVKSRNISSIFASTEKSPSKTVMFCQKSHAYPICNNSIKKKNNVMRAKIIQRATTLTAAMQYTIFAQLT